MARIKRVQYEPSTSGMRRPTRRALDESDLNDSVDSNLSVESEAETVNPDLSLESEVHDEMEVKRGKIRVC
jgi:hypothetical protein